MKAITAVPKTFPIHVNQLKDFREEELVEQVQAANSEILWHSFLKEMNGVLDVESDHFTQRHVLQFLVGEERKPLEDELMVVKVNDGWAVGQEIGGGGHGNAVVVQALEVVAAGVTIFYVLLARVDVVADTAPSSLNAAPTQRAVVHLARVVVPQLRMEAQRVFPFAFHLCHPLAAHFIVAVRVRLGL